MSNPITATNLIDEVRDLLDESNNNLISSTDILQALNRAQDDAVGIMVRLYPEPLITQATDTTVAGTSAYDFPADIFEDRILKVEAIEGTSRWELKRIDYQESTNFYSPSSTSRPYYYYIMGKQVVVVPDPTAGLTLRFWYIKEVEDLVEQQGRVTSIDVANGYILVDDLGADLTTVSNDLENYVSVVNPKTGLIRATLQVETLTTASEKIQFKSTPDRSTVYNKTIVGTIPSTVALDDYVCLAKGNCIPFIRKPLKNYIILSSVIDLKGAKLGESVEEEKLKLEELKKSLKAMWSGRENSLRIRKKSKIWPKYTRN